MLIQPEARNVYILDKTLSKNWELGWHQDLFVSVKEIKNRFFLSKMKKGPYWFCVPPLEILQDMVIARIYLDEFKDDHGSMQVLPKSHKYGMICGKYNEIIEQDKYDYVMNFTPKCPIQDRGSLMLFTPLIVHNSPSSKSDKNRRVLQIEFCGQKAMDYLSVVSENRVSISHS